MAELRGIEGCNKLESAVTLNLHLTYFGLAGIGKCSL